VQEVVRLFPDACGCFDRARGLVGAAEHDQGVRLAVLGFERPEQVQRLLAVGPGQVEVAE
jgi:hypothetical protein